MTPTATATLLVFWAAQLVDGDAGSWRRSEYDPARGIVTSMAPIPGGAAMGTSSGGLLRYDAQTGKIESVAGNGGARIRKVHSLAWAAGGLWIASDAGFLRWDPATGSLASVSDRPGGSPGDVRAVSGSTRGLWAASPKSVWYFQPGRPDSWREWPMPILDPPGPILRVGSRLLVGTQSKGLFVLDSATGTWVRFGRTDGLSSDQVVGLEWVGAEVFVATPEGIDLLDLSSQKIRPFQPTMGASWMTQSNGSLLVETEDGLVRIDPGSRNPVAIPLAAGARAAGSLLAHGGRLLVASNGEICDRAEPTILGDEPLEIAPQGFAVKLARRLPDKTLLQAYLRIPEWPDAKMPLGVELSADRIQASVRLPQDARGRVQVDLVAMTTDSVVSEIRSLEGAADRTRPTLGIDPVRAATRDSVVEIHGRVLAVAPAWLVRVPGGVGVPVGVDGSFRERLPLAPGTNRFRWDLSDGIGNKVAREVLVRRDEQPPKLAAVVPDTVSGDFARVRVRLWDEGPVAASVRGPGQARVAVFDSFLVLEARMLSVGQNQFLVTAVDDAGNSSQTTVVVVRSSSNLDNPSSSWSFDGFRSFYRTVAVDSTQARRGVSVVRYSMLEGETLCGVAERFYGSQILATVLIQWNGMADSSQWRRMPVGTLVEVPFWRDIDHRDPDVKGILESFPWERMPVNRRQGK